MDKLNQKGIIQFLIIGLVAVSIIAGVILVQKYQIFKPKAATPTIASIQPDPQIVTLSSKLLDLNKEGKADQMVDIAQKRKDLLLEKLATNPQAFLVNATLADKRDSFPDTIKLYIEEKISVGGNLSVLHGHTPDDKKSINLYSLKSDQGVNYVLYPTQESEDLQTNRAIEVKGITLDQAIVVQSIDLLVQGVSTSNSRGRGEVLQAVAQNVNVAVILVKFQNYNLNTMPDEIENIMFNGTNSISKYYEENSGGRIKILGDVLGWHTIPFTVTDNSLCNIGAWEDSADAKVISSGVNLNNYSKKFYVLGIGRPYSCPLGASIIGGNSAFSFLNDPSTIAHELGHTLNTNHAALRACPPKSIDIPSRCQDTSYGDIYDVMGSSNVLLHFNGARKAQKGWATVSEVTTNGTYNIYPLELVTSNPQVLKIKKPDTNEYYFISYRQRIGFDNNFFDDKPTKGVSIHVARLDSADHTYSLDASPSNSFNTVEYTDTALSDGNTFIDEVNNISIKQINHILHTSTASGSATVEVRFGDSFSTPSLSRRAFVTSQQFNGNLGGLSGADQKCQQAAISSTKYSDLKNSNWVAWLSDSNTPVSSRLTHPFGTSYKLVDGTSLASNWNDLTDNSIGASINKDQNGDLVALDYQPPINLSQVWTSSNGFGERAGSYGIQVLNPCNNWTSSASSLSNRAVFGNAYSNTYEWTIYGGIGITMGCENKSRLYCFEEPAAAPVPSPSPSPSPTGGTVTPYTVSYKLAENPVELATASARLYDKEPALTDYIFKNSSPGIKFLWAEFKDNIGNLATRSAQIEIVAPTPSPTPIPSPVATVSATPNPSPIGGPQATICTLTDGDWNEIYNTVDAGTTVKLEAHTSGNCVGKEVEFKVWEDDGLLGSDPVLTNPSPALITGNKVASTWISEYQCDGLACINDPPEYYFEVNIVGDSKKIRSGEPKLFVKKSSSVSSPTSPSTSGAYLVKPYLVYPADKPIYPEYEVAVKNYMLELQNWYKEKVGVTFQMDPLVVVRSNYNYNTMRCDPNPKDSIPPLADCLSNQNRIDGNWGMYMNLAIHDGEEKWEEKTAALVFGAGGGGDAGANKYPNDAGFALVGDWVLEPLSGKANDWGIPCKFTEIYCSGGIPKGTAAHELGHAFGLPHPDINQYPGTGVSIMRWHGDFPQVGFLPHEVGILKASPFFKSSQGGLIPQTSPTPSPIPSPSPIGTANPSPSPQATSIKITSPNGGETLKSGEVYRITWNATSDIDLVDIAYISIEQGRTYTNKIIKGHPNTGFYDWKVDVGNTANTQFQIDVVGYHGPTNRRSLIADRSDKNFTVSHPLPSPTPTPTPVTRIIKQFRVAEDFRMFDWDEIAAPKWQDYTPGVTASYTFNDKSLGQKFIFVQFKDDQGNIIITKRSGAYTEEWIIRDIDLVEEKKPVEPTPVNFGKAIKFTNPPDSSGPNRAEVLNEDNPGLNQTSQITVEAWIKPDRINPATGLVLLKYEGDDSGGAGIDNQYLISVRKEGHVMFHFETTSPTEPYGFCQDVGLLEDSYQNSGWYHIAMVFDRGVCRGFVNGKKRGGIARPTPGEVIDTRKTGKFYIGGVPDALTGHSERRGFNGEIDEIRVSNNARYTANFTPSGQPFAKDANTVALWRFDDSFTDLVTSKSARAIGDLSFVESTIGIPAPTLPPPAPVAPPPVVEPVAPPPPAPVPPSSGGGGGGGGGGSGGTAPPPARVIQYVKVAENSSDIWAASPRLYSRGMEIDYTFKNSTPCRKNEPCKFIFVQFIDNKGEVVKFNGLDYITTSIELIAPPAPVAPIQPVFTPPPPSFSGPAPLASDGPNCPFDNPGAYSIERLYQLCSVNQLTRFDLKWLVDFPNNVLIDIGRRKGNLGEFLANFSGERLLGLYPYENAGFSLEILRELPSWRKQQLPGHIYEQIR